TLLLLYNKRVINTFFEKVTEMNGSVTVNHLSASYNGNEVVKDISFSFETGRLIGIIGPNGAGKSTMMKAILDLIPKKSGQIEFCNKPINHVRKKIAYIPQRSTID